jgi:hypothetical protein
MTLGGMQFLMFKKKKAAEINLVLQEAAVGCTLLLLNYGPFFISKNTIYLDMPYN